jgi:hypothetical protein
MVRRASWMAAALGLWLLLPGMAHAAVTKPGVITGAAASVTQSTVTLTGSVDPNRSATTYFFQYGTTSLYGQLSSSASAGKGSKAVHVAIPVALLLPFTTYHYRLVAQNAKGLTKGKDRKFRTKRQPLGLTLGAAPEPVSAGRPVVIAGTLTGTRNANREVVLQSNPFPYTQGFLNVGNPQLTGPTGAFSFTLPAVPLNSQFRVLMPNNLSVVSPIVFVGVKPLVTIHVRRRGRVLRFSGSVRPALVGVRVSVQKRRHHRWVTVGRALTRRGTATRAVYVKRVRQRAGGSYRVLVRPAGNYANAGSRRVRVHLR